MKLDVKITGSPKGFLLPGAKIAGHLSAVNDGGKKVHVEQLYVNLSEVWQGPKPLPEKWGEHWELHDQAKVIAVSKKSDCTEMVPGGCLEFDFALTMPSSWMPRPDPENEWAFKVRAHLCTPNNKETWSSKALVAPVAGSPLIPSWKFDQEKEGWICSVCGSQNLVNAKLCVECGGMPSD